MTPKQRVFFFWTGLTDWSLKEADWTLHEERSESFTVYSYFRIILVFKACSDLFRSLFQSGFGTAGDLVLIFSIYSIPFSGFGGLEVACWLLVPKFASSNPTEAVGFFRAKKILSTPSFGGEVKPSVPYSRFTACKRFLNVTWKSGTFRQNSSAICRPM